MANLLEDRALMLNYGTDQRTVRLYDTKPVASYVGKYTGATAAAHPTGTIVKSDGTQMYYHLDPWQTPRMTGHFMYGSDGNVWSVHGEYNPERMDLSNGVYWDYYDHPWAYGNGISEITSVEKKFGTTSYLMAGKGLVHNVQGFQLGNANSQWTIEFWCKIPGYPSGVPEKYPAYILLVDQSDANNVRAFTMSACSNYWAIPGNDTNVSTGWSATNCAPFPFFFSGNISTNTYTYTICQGTYHNNAWTHIAIVKNGNTVTYYKNGGACCSSSNVPGDYVSVCALGYDMALINPNAPCLPEGSYYDEVRFSSCARYTGNFTPPTTAFVPDENTVALMHFEF